jgi:hypothetical protein
MATDPVCGMTVDEQQAAGKAEHQGITYLLFLLNQLFAQVSGFAAEVHQILRAFTECHNGI